VLNPVIRLGLEIQKERKKQTNLRHESHPQQGRTRSSDLREVICAPLRLSRGGCEKGSGYSHPHWEKSKGRASLGSGPQSDFKINEIEL